MAIPVWWVANWRQNIFKDTGRPATPATSVVIVAARNETEAAQIVIRHNQAHTVTSVSSSNLTATSGTLSNVNFKYHFVDYFFSGKNSGGDGYCDVTMEDPVRVAPAEFPEQLSNSPMRAVLANVTQPIWIKYRIPTTQPVGMYTGTITVSTTLGNFTVPVSIEVNNVTLPDPADSDFSNEWWIYPHSIAAPLGITEMSAEWWSVVDDLAAICRECRMNVIIGFIQYFWNKTDDFTLFDDYIQRFSNLGGMKRISSETMNANAVPWITRIRTHFIAQGWWTKFIYRITDEPTNVSAYITLSNQVRAVHSDVHIGDPGINNPTGYGTSVDIWIPHLTYQNDYLDFKSTFNAKKLLPGNEVWLYTVCFPTNSAINVHIDNRIFETTLHGWYCFKENISGFLFWGFQNWEEYGGPGDEYYQTVGTLGDRYLLWPDVPNTTIKQSVRSEAVRELAEDYELLRILEAKDSVLAHSICDSVITSPFIYEKNIATLESKRNQLVRAAADAPPAATNYDLTVSNLTLTPSNPVVNDLVTFSVLVSNVGTDPTPDGIIHSVAFQVDGVTMTWSDDWTTSIPAGGSRVQTANGGWTPTGAQWLAALGPRVIRAFVDDVNRFPEEANKANNQISVNIEVQAEAVPPEPGQICPFVEWNFVTFEDGLIRMAHRAARNRAFHRLNSTFVRSWSPAPGTNGIVGTPHVVTVECRLSGSVAGQARLYLRGFNKLNGEAEVASQILIGAAGIGNWTPLTATFTHVPHNNPKVPDALTALLVLDHNGFGACEWRNVTIEIPPV